MNSSQFNFHGQIVMIFVQKPAKTDESYLRYGEKVFVNFWAKRAIYGREINLR